MPRLLRRRALANEVPVDLTPMIDVVFLLLVFFILTTTFRPEEHQLAALLPPSGASPTERPPILPPPTVRLALVPVGLPEQATQAEYQHAAARVRQDGPVQAVALRLGHETVAVLDLRLLRADNGLVARAELERFCAHLDAALAQREIPAAIRAEAPPVEIHAWSGLPWASVTTLFDGIRAYERERFGTAVIDRRDLSQARRIDFAQPTVRNHRPDVDGEELWRLMRM